MTVYTFRAGGRFAGSLFTLGRWRAGVLPRVVHSVMAAKARPCLGWFIAAFAKVFQSLRSSSRVWWRRCALSLPNSRSHTGQMWSMLVVRCRRVTFHHLAFKPAGWRLPRHVIQASSNRRRSLIWEAESTTVNMASAPVWFGEV